MQSIWSAENNNTFCFPKYLIIVLHINSTVGNLYSVTNM